MAAKNVDPSSGIQEQIDQLDALLDRLLQLPLGPPPEPVPSKRTSSSPSAEASPDASGRLLEEPLTFGESILHFPEAASEGTPRPALPASRSTEDSPGKAYASLEHLPNETQAPAQAASAPVSPLPAVPTDPQAIPWIDDDPTGQPPVPDEMRDVPAFPASPFEASHPASSTRPAGEVGARIEIVIGPTKSVVAHRQAEWNEDSPALIATRPSVLKKTAWYWNIGFYSTIGALFPTLRRPLARRILGMLGLTLIAASVYLALRGFR
jgi:hypothetical protein